MRIEFEERTWEFDPDSMDVRQATVLYMTYQLTIAQYSDGFDVLDQRVYHFAYWLMLQQNGVIRPIADCNPNIIKFIAAVTDARVADAAEEAAREAEALGADPTQEPPSGPQGEPTASKASATRTGTTRRHRDQPQEVPPTGS